MKFGDHSSASMFSQTAFTCSKLAIETLKQGMKYVQSLLLTLSIFHTLLKYFYCWLWTCNCRSGPFISMFCTVNRHHPLSRYSNIRGLENVCYSENFTYVVNTSPVLCGNCSRITRKHWTKENHGYKMW